MKVNKIEHKNKISSLRALAETTGWSLIFAVVTFLLTLVARQVATSLGAVPQLRASLIITGIAIGQWAVIGLFAIMLRRQSSSFRALGLRGGAPWWVWLLAIAVGVLGAISDLRGVLNGHAFPLQLSLFRIYGGVVVAVTAAFCEESLFRGYIMTRLRDAGAGSTVQILASGIL